MGLNLIALLRIVLILMYHENDGGEYIVRLVGKHAFIVKQSLSKKRLKMEQEKDLLSTCCICGHKFLGYGHNASPVVENGYCCDKCNSEKVIPKRMEAALKAGFGKECVELD